MGHCTVPTYAETSECVRIDGSTDGDTRDFYIDAFNKPGSEKFLFLLSTRAGGSEAT